MNDLVANPYGSSNTVAPTTGNTMDVEINRSLAEVQSMVFMAKKFPRNPIEATERILNECQRVGLAEVALYSYSRGGTDISGPSIRLAESIARNWGNLDVGVRELSQANGQSEMMSYCWDIENNSRQSKIFTVKHERHTKKGSYALSDPRDVYEATANQAARRLRAVILSVVPGDVIEAAVRQCEETLKAKADTSPDAMKKMVEKFGDYGVTKEQIEKRIQRRIDAITPAQVVSLRKIYNSLRDSMSAVGDWFEASASVEVELTGKTTGNAGLKSALASKKTPVQEPAKEAHQIPCPREPGETRYVETCESGNCQEKGNCKALSEYRDGLKE
jgi:hypothetical protein